MNEPPDRESIGIADGHVRRRCVAWLVGLPLALWIAARCALWLEPLVVRVSPGCTLRNLTGIYCPGCGGTRSFFALLHGHWSTALRANVLPPILMLVAGAWAVKQIMREFPRAARWAAIVRCPAWLIWLFGGAIILYGIMRNLPWPSFACLRPG